VTPVIDLGARRVEYAGTPATRLYVLIGDPVVHSLSPVMQAAAFRAAGLDAAYVACRVPAAELGNTFAALRRSAEFGGGNVTVPHKRAALEHLDALDAIALLSGAANTIVPRRDASGAVVLHGANTDAIGLVPALSEIGAHLAGARLLVLGAGGMARAAVAAGFEHGAQEIRVAARDPLGAQEMLDAMSRTWRGREPHLACLSLADAAAALPGADVLVQATSLGRGGETVIGLETAPPALCILDAVYAPGGTPLVQAARARGLAAADGLSLLAHQGAASFTLWTGVPAPLAAMRSALGL
jgi:shikimate dehydrogenase